MADTQSHTDHDRLAADHDVASGDATGTEPQPPHDQPVHGVANPGPYYGFGSLIVYDETYIDATSDDPDSQPDTEVGVGAGD